MDIQPVRNIEPMLGDATVVLPVTPNLGLTNAFMACTKNNAFMKHVTGQLESYANRWYHFTRHWQILTSTGPTFIWKVADAYTGSDAILRVPASVWGKCMICASSCPVVEEGYFQHLHGDSWHNWDSWLFTYVIFCHHYTMIFLGWLLLLLILLRQDTPGWMWSHREVVAASVGMFLMLMLFQGA
jgi:mannosyltransferase OCH1-like enzyme